MSLLQVTSLGKEFDGLRALEGVSFSVEPAQILGIIGPNGAGKTTLGIIHRYLNKTLD